MPQTARPTLEQVARHCGVSTATVSKVLNHRPDVAPTTRTQVEAALEQMGYVPSTGPRTVNALHEVHVVVNTVLNAYVMQALDGILSAAASERVEILVDSLDAHGEPSGAPLSQRWCEHAVRRGRAGVILVTAEMSPEQRRRLESLGIAVVAVDPVDPLDDGLVSIGGANFTGGVQAAGHLIELGHTRFGFAGAIIDRLPGASAFTGS
ncbi:LacI family transcriptional regulator [Nesterenkonia pannonica]|uniref:LacI family DNA-binding transcriptional regulator n=1 Tax=Nesterenkonia pannonica TaxID=1548602 RepID=UPI0021640516|nr:LacI family DNA-binding transcriptional regulator [Nesterenkonia pannonica]